MAISRTRQVTNSHPLLPRITINLTKYEGEKVVQEYVNKGLDAVTLRPTAIYGPGDPERFLILFRMVKRESFLMFGDGETFYHPVYIDNLVDAFELAADKEGVRGKTYIIGDCRLTMRNSIRKRSGSPGP